MVKKIIVRTLFAVFFFLFFVVYLAPANKLFSLAELPRDIKIYDVRGSLWNGEIGTADISNVRINNISWKLNFFTLFFSRGVSFTVNDNSLVTGNFDVDIFSLSKGSKLNNIELKGDAKNIIEIFYKNFPVDIVGGLETQIQELSFTKNGSLEKVNGKVFLKRGELTTGFLPDVAVDLGKVELTANGNEKNLMLNIEQDSEMLHFSGKMTITDMKSYTISGNLKPKGALPEKLGILLSTIGAPDAKGNIPVEYQGQF